MSCGSGGIRIPDPSRDARFQGAASVSRGRSRAGQRFGAVHARPTRRHRVVVSVDVSSQPGVLVSASTSYHAGIQFDTQPHRGAQPCCCQERPAGRQLLLDFPTVEVGVTDDAVQMIPASQGTTRKPVDEATTGVVGTFVLVGSGGPALRTRDKQRVVLRHSLSECWSYGWWVASPRSALGAADLPHRHWWVLSGHASTAAAAVGLPGTDFTNAFSLARAGTKSNGHGLRAADAETSRHEQCLPRPRRPRRMGRTRGIPCHRRLVRDYERLPEHHEAMVLWATVMIMTRQLARHTTGTPPQPRWGGDRPAPPPNQINRPPETFANRL